MPARSQSQFRYMGAVASGRVRSKNLSREDARKFLHESKGMYDKLPGKVKMKMDKSGDTSNDNDADEKMAGMRGKFAKNTYAKGKKPTPKKGKKMSRADFMKMVREKKFAKKKK
jgi:hypothetical protein